MNPLNADSPNPQNSNPYSFPPVLFPNFLAQIAGNTEKWPPSHRNEKLIKISKVASFYANV